MSKELDALEELTPLDALEDIILYLNANEPKGLYCKNIEIIKTALEEYEGAKNHIEALHKERVENAIKIKVLEIIKSSCEFDFLEEKINDMPTKYEIHIRPKNKEQLLFTCLAIFPKSKEDYDLLKEIL